MVRVVQTLVAVRLVEAQVLVVGQVARVVLVPVAEVALSVHARSLIPK
jgi:hypothetical protein